MEYSLIIYQISKFMRVLKLLCNIHTFWKCQGHQHQNAQDVVWECDVSTFTAEQLGDNDHSE